MTISDWWHKRTDGVEGIHKLIGEPHSMFRANVVYLGGGVVLGTIFLVWLFGKSPDA